MRVIHLILLSQCAEELSHKYSYTRFVTSIKLFSSEVLFVELNKYDEKKPKKQVASPSVTTTFSSVFQDTSSAGLKSAREPTAEPAALPPGVPLQSYWSPPWSHEWMKKIQKLIKTRLLTYKVSQ